MQTVETRRTTLGTIKGNVIKGRQLAGKLGFPTANLQTESVRGEFRTGCDEVPERKTVSSTNREDFWNVSRRFERMASAEDELHLTDLDFSKLCEDVYGVNRGVYNTIDSLFYGKGFTHIMDRRKTILTFLEYLHYQADVNRTSRIKFGNGGLTTKLQDFCQFYLRGC